jgi:hypothetical protein
MMVRLARVLMLPLTGAALLGACTEDPNDDPSAGTTGESAASTTGDAPTTAADASTGGDTGGETSTPTTGTPTTGEDSSTGAGSDTDTDTDTDTGEPSPWDGEPLPGAEDGVWTWVDFPEAQCRDGSATGIGVRYGSGSGVAIYFEGGGACFNAVTCQANPSSFDGGDFNSYAKNANGGIYDANNPDNPLADWTFIFVPYCTGDVHAGARPDASIAGVGGTQQFVGYLNVEKYLERIVPTFIADTDHVLVTGQSAGGFGAAFNYDRIADAFPGKKVTLLDDSGPPMSDAFMVPCLQKMWRDAWGLDDTMPADCANCFPANGGGIVNLGRYLGNKHTGQKLGLISSVGDNTIRFFFGFGNNNCTPVLPSTTVERFTMGLNDLRDNWLDKPDDTWGTFYLSGEQHTWITGGSFTSATSGGGVKLIDWVRDLLDGAVANVEP